MDKDILSLRRQDKCTRARRDLLGYYMLVLYDEALRRATAPRYLRPLSVHHLKITAASAAGRSGLARTDPLSAYSELCWGRTAGAAARACSAFG